MRLMGAKMAASGDTKIKTILTADSSDFEAGLKRAAATLQQAEGKFNQSSNNMKKSLTGVSGALSALEKNFGVALGAAAIVGFGRQILGVADKLQTLEDRTGVSASTFRKYQAEIENSGGSLDDLGLALGKLNIKFGQAQGGSKEAIAAFASVGISMKQLAGLTVEEKITKVLTAISNIKDPSERAAAAFTLLGKGAQPLLPFLDDFAARAATGATWTDKLAESMGPDTIQTLDTFGDHLNTLSIALTNLAATGLANAIKTFQTLGLQVAQIGILAGKNAGLIDKDIADSALADAANQIDNKFSPSKDPANAKKASNRSSKFTDPTGINEAKGKAESLKKAIQKLNDKSSNDLTTASFTELGKKIADVKFQADELAKQYDTKLTPAELESIKATQANVEALYNLERQQTINKELASDIGKAFTDSFEEAALSAKSFGDIVSDLGKTIEKALFNAVVTKPLGNFFSDFSSKATGNGTGGIGSLISSIFGSSSSASSASGSGGFFSSIGSLLGFAGGGAPPVGKPYVVGEHGPEIRVDSAAGQIIPNSAIGGGGGVNLTIINNTDSNISSSANKSGNGTDLSIQIDRAVAKNANDKSSATSQALRARENRTLIRR